MAKTNFSNLQTQYASPHTHILEDVGVWLMKGCFRPMRIVTLKPEEHGPLVPTAEKVMVIKQEQQLNWAANFLASASLWKARVVKCLLAVASVPFIPFTLLGAAFVVLFRNTSKMNQKEWADHLKKEDQERPSKLIVEIENRHLELVQIANDIFNKQLTTIDQKVFNKYKNFIDEVDKISTQNPSNISLKETITTFRNKLRSFTLSVSTSEPNQHARTSPQTPAMRRPYNSLQEEQDAFYRIEQPEPVEQKQPQPRSLEELRRSVLLAGQQAFISLGIPVEKSRIRHFEDTVPSVSSSHL